MTNWWSRNKPSLEISIMLATIALLVALAILMVLPGFARAATVTLAWQANPESDVAGYRLWRANTACSQAGTTAFRIIQTIQTGTFTSDVVGKGTYCYRLTAFDIAGNESAPSIKRQVTILQDGAPSGFVVQSVAP